MLEPLQAANASVTARPPQIQYESNWTAAAFIQYSQFTDQPLAFGAEPKKVAVAFAGLTDPLDASICDLLTAALQHRLKGELALADVE